MASVVGAFGVPHTPIFPMLVAREGPESETAKLFAGLTEHLVALRPDVIVMFDTDHMNTFFLDNLPIFAIGVDNRFGGPNDEPPTVPDYRIPSVPGLAEHIRGVAVNDGYDLALVQDFTVDHSIVVPLHFMTPQMQVPVIPIFVSGHLEPMPPAQRVHALGRIVRGAIESWPEAMRVVVMGSGSFSLEVCGPRMAPGLTFGVPDPDWAMRICRLMEEDDVETLIGEATPHRMLKAGNVGGELLNWIAMLGAAGRHKPVYVAPQMGNGHAYGVWRWS